MPCSAEYTPVVFAILLQIWLIWCFQLRFPSICTPNSLVDSTCLIFESSDLILTCCLNLLFFALNISNWVLFILRDSLLAFNQSETFFSSSFTVLVKAWILLFEQNILVLSAKRINESILELLWISLLYKRNFSAPKT